MNGDSTYRATDAYKCASWDCGKQGIGVETRRVQPNGMASSLGFYGYCAEHDPRVFRADVDNNKEGA